MSHQIGQDLELPLGQLQVLAAAQGASLQQVQLQVAGPQDGFAIRLPAPQQGANPGEQFGEGKRLDEVIVCTGVEAGHAVLNVIARGQDQNGCGPAGAAQLGQHFQAALSGQQEIQHDAIEWLRNRQAIPLVPVGGGDDLVPLSLQAVLQAAEDLALILDHEYAGHGASPVRVWRNERRDDRWGIRKPSHRSLFSGAAREREAHERLILIKDCGGPRPQFSSFFVRLGGGFQSRKRLPEDVESYSILLRQEAERGCASIPTY